MKFLRKPSFSMQMVELHNSSILDLQKIGFTYPEDSDMDSLELLKQHEIRLSQTKDALLGQQTRLKRALQNLKKLKKGKETHSMHQLQFLLNLPFIKILKSYRTIILKEIYILCNIKINIKYLVYSHTVYRALLRICRNNLQ